MKPQRNDPCPCGSGKKYKNCHGGKTLSALLGRRGVMPMLAIAFIGGTIALVMALNTDTDTGKTPANVPPPSSPAPGKVWSEEHGHWHDAATENQSMDPQPTQQQQNPAPQGGPPFQQPPGPVPQGKVWSPEHGHWHDVANNQTNTTMQPQTTSAPMPQPEGPVPEGKEWSKDHGHWHDVAPPPTTPQPVEVAPFPPPVPSDTSRPSK